MKSEEEVEVEVEVVVAVVAVVDVVVVVSRSRGRSGGRSSRRSSSRGSSTNNNKNSLIKDNLVSTGATKAVQPVKAARENLKAPVSMSQEAVLIGAAELFVCTARSAAHPGNLLLADANLSSSRLTWQALLHGLGTSSECQSCRGTLCTRANRNRNAAALLSGRALLVGPVQEAMPPAVAATFTFVPRDVGRL